MIQSALLCSRFFITCFSCALVIFARADHRINADIHVRDVDGQNVSDAKVTLALPRYGTGRVDQSAEGRTNDHGKVKLSGKAEQAYQLFVEKAGYYSTQTRRISLTTHDAVQRNAKGPQAIELVLRPIRNPISALWKNVSALPAPALNEKFGFDFEIGDWVAPHGKGKNGDAFFEIRGYVNSREDYKLAARISFPNELDGIQRLEFEDEHGSAFKLPYDAPLSGYVRELNWDLLHSGPTMVLRSGNAYLFRIRSEPDSNGNVGRALYGVISERLRVAFVREKLGWNFVYQLNPGWTRNLEFDWRRLIEAGTGHGADSFQ